MRYAVFATFLTISGSSDGFARYCEGGQQPVPPAVAAQMALPLCGFAATKRWGPNGCQLCDARNMYPNPFAGYEARYAAPRARPRHPRKW
jgi:hypothetical protein